jgi:hypothetical protein
MVGPRSLVRILAAVPLALSACLGSPPDVSSPGESDASLAESEDSESLLYVQTARSATLTPVPGQADMYRLILTNVDPRVAYFSDRPQRDTGTIAIPDLFEAVFVEGKSAPNAALVGHEMGQDVAVTLSFELTMPNYNEGAREVSYDARALDALSEGLSHLNLAPLDAPPAAFSEVELFLDSDSYHRCWGTLKNNTSHTFTLDEANVDPSTNSPKWANVAQTIGPHSQANWTFRFHTDNTVHDKDKVGTLVYLSDQKYSLSPVLSCSYAANGYGVALDAPYSSCGVDLYASPFTCTFERKGKGRTLDFTVSPK